MQSAIFQKLSDAIQLPRLIQLDKNLYVAAFSIMKLLPAKHIIEEALKRGEIKKNSLIVDTSSGTFALGVGMVCAELGLPFKIFGDPAIDILLINQLQDLGGEVHISKNPPNPGAYQALRLEALKNFISTHQLSYWTQQYDNLDNARAYHIVGEYLMQLLGNHLNIVGTVGSGGSTCGIIHAIRQQNPDAQLIGVDTFNSILFGQPDGKRILRGLGNSIMPKNLQHVAYDEIHWVNANDAFYYTRWLFQHKALFLGPTSGAAYQVAQYLAKKNKHNVYVFIAPDEGYRYQNTVYNNAWLHHQDFYSTILTKAPKRVSNPLNAHEPWSYMHWGRRTYHQVMGENCEP